MARTLIRFTRKKDHARQFMDGNIYMNTLSYFWNNGFDEQKDIFEGTCLTFSGNGTGFQQDFIDANLADFRIRLSAYQYVNLCCFYRADYDEMNSILQRLNIELMSKFGLHAIVIDDEREFTRRIIRAADKQYAYCICGDVNYHALKKDGRETHAKNVMHLASPDEWDIDKMIGLSKHIEYMDCFDKWNIYSAEREWRVCLNRKNTCENACILKIGPIHDISHYIYLPELTMDLLCKYHPSVLGQAYPQKRTYIGNVGREQFAKSVINLRPNRGFVISSIG